MKPAKFVVVDTEGSGLLKELAIVDEQGTLIYQALVQEHPDHQSRSFHTQPLKQVMADFLRLTEGCRIICHYAEHDRRILQQACREAGLSFRLRRQFVCSCKLAQRYFPDLPSYSLEYLSKKLHLQVNQRYFDPRQAHAARYDAAFTYALYRKILAMQSGQPVLPIQNQPNPFSSSRVDTPFQDHPDQKQVYQSEFDLLKATIQEIRQDQNHQSRGAVIIGEPGSGKTHLMMRLAKELLQVNRLLFIRHPNNPNAVLYHIYSRILESLIQKVPENGYTQLENLLAHSFVQLLQRHRHANLTKNDQLILAAVESTPLNLYRLATEGTEKKRLLWQHIEKRISEWWVNEYGFAGHSTQLIKGIIKFCSYSDSKRQQIVARWLAANELDPEALERVGLSDWQEELSKEEFSLEAISVFSKLSLLDEPLIIVFDQLEGLGLAHQQMLLLNFGEAVKEIFTHVPNSLLIFNLFPDRWQQFRQVLSPAVVERMAQTQIHLSRPSQAALEAILQLKAQTVDIDITTFFTPAERQTILSQSSIRAMLNCAADYFRYKVHSIALPNSTTAQPPTTASPPDATPTSIEQRLARLEAGFAALQQVFRQLADVSNPCSVAVNPSHATEPFPAPAVESVPESDPIPHLLFEYLQPQRRFLEKEYSLWQIVTDSDDLGKLMTIAEAYQALKSFEIDYLRYGNRRLPEHLVLRSAKRNVAVGFLQLNGGAFTARLKNWNELMISHRDVQFQLWRDQRQPAITGNVGRTEIEKLNHASNGVYQIMDVEQRLDFELLYRLIVDIQNRDLSIELPAALKFVSTELKNSWICQLFDSL